jgi:DNA modification methylase
METLTMIQILQGDWIERLRGLPDCSVKCCVTSPPYWGLRDYGVAGQLGLEKTPAEYVERLTTGFAEVRRVLSDDGTLWLNLGDSYAGSGMTGGTNSKEGSESRAGRMFSGNRRDTVPGMKQKDLVGIPWAAAFALRSDGWYLRSDIIWHKPNPMPESVTDRPTKAHEYIFLLSKSQKYFYDAAAIAEPVSDSMLKQIEEGYNGHSTKDFFGHKAQDASGTKARIIEGYRKRIAKEGQNSRIHVSRDPQHEREYTGKHRNEHEQNRGRRLLKNTAEARAAGGLHDSPFGLTRNKRTVWTTTTAPYREAHFATFPPELITPCILAGSGPGDTVLDPFFGSGTTGQVALELGRKCIGIELNPAYIELAKQRTNITPGLQLA